MFPTVREAAVVVAVAVFLSLFLKSNTAITTTNNPAATAHTEAIMITLS